MQKVKFYYTAEIIASVPFNNITCIICLPRPFPRVEIPADMKVSDNKKIKVT